MFQLHPQNFRHIDSPQRTSCWMRPKEFSDMQTKASGPPDGKVPVLLSGRVLCWVSRLQN